MNSDPINQTYQPAAPSALERRRLALEKIDNAKFSWYHVRAIIVAGVGLYFPLKTMLS
jgi:hypothetical protein